MKKYRAVIFDWDGTAVESRTAPTDEIIPLMIKMLERDVKLVIISGTTYENIAGGRMHELIPARLLGNLYLGLGRGAYNYRFDENGNAQSVYSNIPDLSQKIKIHTVCFDIHQYLLEYHGYETDIIFSRPNYCKIDLLVDLDRKGKLFLRPGEIDLVSKRLEASGYAGGIRQLMEFAAKLGTYRKLDIKATTDAKYLEVGISTKSDNVDYILDEIIFKQGIKIEDCCFWGDEFTSFGDGIFGSDAYMLTKASRGADFFDVSDAPLALPEGVQHIGGGIHAFRNFLELQSGLA